LEPLENKVHFLVVQRRLSEALELQNLLVDRASQNPVEYIQRAQILLAMGRAQDSILSAQKAVDLDDYFIPGYVAKAQAMEALGKRADAVQIDRIIEEIIKKQNIPDLDQRLKQVEADIQRLQSKR
jgi:predicted Zn-dependent protease